MGQWNPPTPPFIAMVLSLHRLPAAPRLRHRPLPLPLLAQPWGSGRLLPRVEPGHGSVRAGRDGLCSAVVLCLWEEPGCEPGED